MQYVDVTLPSAAENLAADEALLEWAEEEDSGREFLRVWESPQPMVVVGRSSRVEKEVDVSACRSLGIPILRRSSGGAAIVAGPGCLMYAVVLSHRARPELRDIGRAHAFVMDRIVASLGARVAQAGKIVRAGTSDLVFERGTSSEERGASGGEQEFLLPAPCSLLPAAGVRKFSGNSLRVKRTHLLYHGTLLYAFDLALIETCLRMPPRRPDYRGARSHNDFVMNLALGREAVVEAVREAWPTESGRVELPMSRVERLVAERFGAEEWTYEFG